MNEMRFKVNLHLSEANGTIDLPFKATIQKLRFYNNAFTFCHKTAFIVVGGMKIVVKSQWGMKNKLDQSLSMKKMPSFSLDPIYFVHLQINIFFYQSIDFGLN